MPKVVTCLLINDKDKLLVLKRSEKVKTYKGQWGGVAGYIEENEKPVETAYKELKEEVKLNKKEVQLIKTLEPIRLTNSYLGEKYDWEIYVFVFKTKKTIKIQIDWEHIDFKWIQPSEIDNYNTVPYFKEIVSKILLK